MITLEGHYFDGRQPIGLPAAMNFSGQESVLTAGPISESYPSSHLKVSPRIGANDRFITLPNGGQFACADHPFLDTLPRESWSEGAVAWLEQRWGVALACVAIIASTLLAGYFFGLPAAAERISAHIPIETEQALGKHALGWLDEKGWFKATSLDSEARESIKDGFAVLSSDLPLKDRYHLEFRSGLLGANALAFPGGTIVITDDMVRTAESTEEVLAVLAHEIGHVENRHAIRSILQNSVIAAFSAMVTSDAASLSVAVAGLPVLFAQAKYSREFEAAADEYAFDLLKRKGHSPAAFASVMEKLEIKHGKKQSAFTYISSHPITAERVEHARNAAGEDATNRQSILSIAGKWLGEDYQPEVQSVLTSLMHRKPDGTFVIKFHGVVKGETLNQVEEGRWSRLDNRLSSVTSSVNGKPVPDSERFNDSYEIESLTANEMVYRHVKSGQQFRCKRVPDSYELP